MARRPLWCVFCTHSTCQGLIATRGWWLLYRTAQVWSIHSRKTMTRLTGSPRLTENINLKPLLSGHPEPWPRETGQDQYMTRA